MYPHSPDTFYNFLSLLYHFKCTAFTERSSTRLSPTRERGGRRGGGKREGREGERERVEREREMEREREREREIDSLLAFLSYFDNICLHLSLFMLRYL